MITLVLAILLVGGLTFLIARRIGKRRKETRKILMMQSHANPAQIEKRKRSRRIKIGLIASGALTTAAIIVFSVFLYVRYENTHGTCGIQGHDLVWVYDDGVLTISGQGEMRSFYDGWLRWRDDIHTIVVEEGVTYVGRKVFSGVRVKRVSIADSVTSIASDAFNGCSELEEINLSSGLESVSGFDECYSLKSIVFPENIKKIDGFNRCTGLTTVEFPDTVEEIIGFDGCTGLVSLNFPGSVTSIKGFDNCTALKHIQFSEGNKNVIGFSGCTALEYLDFPCSIENIGKSDLVFDARAFDRCTSLQNVHFSEGVININGFDYCTALESLELPDSIESIGDVIGDGSFNYCTGLQCITFPKNTGNVSGFEGCTGVKTIGFSKNTTYVGFGLPSITLASCFPELQSVEFPDSVNKIGYGSFCNCKCLFSISFPENISIDICAFENCSSLKRVTFSSGTEIGRWAFRGCKALKEIVFLGDYPILEGQPFEDVCAEVNYHANNPTWIENCPISGTIDAAIEFGSDITFVPTYQSLKQ